MTPRNKLQVWRQRAKMFIGRRAKDALIQFVHVPVLVNVARRGHTACGDDCSGLFYPAKGTHATLTMRRFTADGNDHAVEFRVTQPNLPGDDVVFVVHNVLPKMRLLWGFLAMCGLADNEVFVRVIEFLDSPSNEDVAEMLDDGAYEVDKLGSLTPAWGDV